MQSLQSINVIQGKPTISADGIKALVMSKGGRYETVEWTDEVCILKCHRGQHSETVSFSMEDAKLQGLADKENWKRMPKQMLYARCSSMLGRNMFADVIKGFYSTEEMIDTAQKEHAIKREERKATEEANAILLSDKEVDERMTAKVVYYYDLNNLPDLDKHKDALIKKHGGEFGEDGTSYRCDKIIPKLKDYLVATGPSDKTTRAILGDSTVEAH